MELPALPITLIVTVVVRSESIGEIARVMTEVADDLPKVDACESVRIVRGLDGSARFPLVGSRTSRTKHEDHRRGVIEQGGREDILGHPASASQGSHREDLGRIDHGAIAGAREGAGVDRASCGGVDAPRLLRFQSR